MSPVFASGQPSCLVASTSAACTSSSLQPPSVKLVCNRSEMMRYNECSGFDHCSNLRLVPTIGVAGGLGEPCNAMCNRSATSLSYPYISCSLHRSVWFGLMFLSTFCLFASIAQVGIGDLSHCIRMIKVFISHDNGACAMQARPSRPAWQCSYVPDSQAGDADARCARAHACHVSCHCTRSRRQPIAHASAAAR